MRWTTSGTYFRFLITLPPIRMTGSWCGGAHRTRTIQSGCRVSWVAPDVRSCSTAWPTVVRSWWGTTVVVSGMHASAQHNCTPDTAARCAQTSRPRAPLTRSFTLMERAARSGRGSRTQRSGLPTSPVIASNHVPRSPPSPHIRGTTMLCPCAATCRSLLTRSTSLLTMQV